MIQIEDIFGEMVDEIGKTQKGYIEPNRYYEGAQTAEVNLVYHFCKMFEKESDDCCVYLEFPCDSGRVDAVVVYENNVFFIEAKSDMAKSGSKKLKLLNAQTKRFEHVDHAKQSNFEFSKEDWLKKYYTDSSLRDTLKDRFRGFFEDWSKVKLFGIVLAESTNQLYKDRWGDQAFFSDLELEVLSSYDKFFYKDGNIHSLWYLGGYKDLGYVK